MAAPLIEGSVSISATPDQVWKVISDLKRMSEWSPQCRKQFVLGGAVKLGTRTININKRGPIVWPTTSTVVRFEPGKQIAFKVTENTTIWSYTITPDGDGVTLTERREAPNGTTKISSMGVDKLFGGEKSFDDELIRDIHTTLGKIKQAVETGH